MILSEKYFSDNIFAILDDPSGQEVNFKVKYDFNIYATNWGTVIHCLGSRDLIIKHHQSEMIRGREVIKRWWRGVKER